MTIEQLKQEIEPLLKERGFELYELTFTNQSNEMILHFAIDKYDGKMDLEATVMLSEWLSEKLDELDWYEGSYTLDVSSPGAERSIRTDEFKRFLNYYINIHLINPYQGDNYLEGELLEVNENEIVLEQTIKTRKKKITIVIANIDKARLAIKF